MENLEEKSVYQYFDELFHAKVVGDEEESLQNYLMAFAKQNGLKFSIDQVSNVVIKDEGEEEKTTLLVRLDFCVRSPEKKWFDFNFWSGKLVRNGDFVLSNRAPLCAKSLGGVAIALHALKSCKKIQAVFIFKKVAGVYKIFEGKTFNSSKIIELTANEKEGVFLSSPTTFKCVAKCSNDKYFLTNSFELKTFKLTIYENEKSKNNLGLKLLVDLLSKIGDAKINSFYSGYVFNNEYKNEITFTSFMPLLELKRLVKFYYEQNKKFYPSLLLKCTRQINQTLVLSSNTIANFVATFKQGIINLDDNQTVFSRLVDVNSNSGFVNFDLLSNNLKTLKTQFENIKDNAKLSNIECVCYDEISGFTNKDSTLLDEMNKANPSLHRDASEYELTSDIGEALKRSKKMNALILSFQVENIGLPDEKLNFSSLVNTSFYVENYIKSLIK